MQIETTLLPDYVSDWGIVEAIKEILQEVFNTKTKYNCEIKFNKDGNKLIIEDNGPGLPISNLILDKFSRTDNYYLTSQFSMGLKLAMLVIARENRKMLIDTVNYRIKPEIKFSKTLNRDVLILKVRKNQRKIGTKFEFECTTEEIEKAEQLYFCQLNVTKQT